MKYCGQCGQEWADSFQYCPNDATPLQAAPADPIVGQLLGNKYKILDPLGRGRHGRVYRAHHRIADQPCAVKLLDAEATQADGPLQQLRSAVRLGLELRSPHTVRLYDFDYAEGVGYFLVEELVEGGSLQTLLQTRGRLPAPLCLSLLRQIADSLADAHAQGLAHGHLTPANVLLRGSFPELTAKISDYGLAGLSGAAEAAPGPTAGTDLVSLGGLLFQMLTGEEAVTSAGGSQAGLRAAEELKAALQRAQVSPPLAELALRLLGLDPSRQLGSAAEVAAALNQVPAADLLKPGPLPAAPSGVEPSEPRPTAGVPSWWSPISTPTAGGEPLPPPEEPKLSLLRVAAVVVLVALVGMTVFWLWRARPAPQSQAAATSTPNAAPSVLLPRFDYQITQRANEGDPVEHPHVLVRVEGLPLYVIRDKGSYPSTVARARAATEALSQAAKNLRGNRNLRFTLTRRGSNPTIVQAGSPQTGSLPIVAIIPADVYAYNVRSHEKTTQGDLAQWWLARTRDYIGLFVSGRAPGLTTRTEDGAALARLYQIARGRRARLPQPAVTTLQPALSGLDPKLKEALQAGVFHFPETDHK